MKLFARRRSSPAAPESPSPAPPSQPLDLVLHVGMDKTGTSSIQVLLRDNRARLAELGVLVPETPGGTRHSRLGLFVKSDDELAESIVWTRQPQSDPAEFRQDFERMLLAEIEESGLKRAIFTDEGLFTTSEPTLGRLGRFSHRIGRSVRLVAYLRRQDDHLISLYQQKVKVGLTERLHDWVDTDLSDTYDYRARLHKFQRQVNPTELIVRRFERASFTGGSLYQDFLDASGVDVRAEEMERGPDRNRSLDAESVEFLRLMNLYRVENKGAVPGLIDNRRWARLLAEASTGPVLSLPTGRLDAFMAQWREPNEVVAREFLHQRELFLMPRKSGGVTTDQVLDPGRLQHFFDLLQVRNEVRAPVRSIAEREARRR